MIIHQPKITKNNGQVVVSARIELYQDIPQFPTSLWFSFPEEYEPWVSNRSDGFVVGVLRMAMFFNEPLEVRGVVSPLLAYNLEECQRIFNMWRPDTFKIIEINYQEFSALPKESTQQAVGLSFSGGVDSLFSLYQHLPHNQPIPSARVTHLLFNQGFSRVDFDDESYQAALEKFQSLAERLDLAVIPANTNARELSEPWFEWEMVYTSAFIGTPLVFSNLFSRFILPSTYSYVDLDRKIGSSPLVDYLFSTETLEFVHHGTAFTRMQKVAAISLWDEAQRILRVCLNPEGNFGVYNCSSCEKCVRTMIMLKMTGNLEKFQTFKLPFRYIDILRLGPRYNPRIPIWWFTSYAFEKKKYHFIPPLVVVYVIGRLRDIATKLFPEFIKRPLKALIYRKNNREYPNR